MSKTFNEKNKLALDSDERKRLLPAETIIPFINLNDHEVFLEIGAGTGYFFTPIVNISNKSNRIIALDISYNMLNDINNKFGMIPPQVELLRADAKQTLLKSKSIDKILLAFVFHEFDTPSKYIKEIERILKPEGQLFILEWNTTPSPFGPPLHERISNNELKSYLSEKNFTIKEEENLNDYNYIQIYQKD